MALEIRGTPDWQIRSYLELLGGTPMADGSYEGNGWRARLLVGEHLAFGLALPKVIITFEGEPARVAAIESALRLRAMRVGG